MLITAELKLYDVDCFNRWYEGLIADRQESSFTSFTQKSSSRDRQKQTRDELQQEESHSQYLSPLLFMFCPIQAKTFIWVIWQTSRILLWVVQTHTPHWTRSIYSPKKSSQLHPLMRHVDLCPLKKGDYKHQAFLKGLTQKLSPSTLFIQRLTVLNTPEQKTDTTMYIYSSTVLQCTSYEALVP